MKTQNLYRILFSLTLVVLFSHSFAATNTIKKEMFSSSANALTNVVEEDALMIENWMTNDRLWYTDDYDSETELMIEGWMTNDTVWAIDEIVSENPLMVRSWMTDNSVWNLDAAKSNSLSADEADGGLEVEAWMVNDSLWKIR